MENIDPKLLKIVALAKEGVGGEKETAIRTLKRLCEREGLNFDEVMSVQDEVHEYTLKVKFKGKAEEDIVTQCCFKYACTEQYPNLKYNKYFKYFFYHTTPSKHIETINAAQIYIKAYRKEKKKIEKDLTAAFINRHNIFSDYPAEKAPSRGLTREEALRRMALAEGMDDVHINKQIEAGDNEIQN